MSARAAADVEHQAVGLDLECQGVDLVIADGNVLVLRVAREEVVVEGAFRLQVLCSSGHFNTFFHGGE